MEKGQNINKKLGNFQFVLKRKLTCATVACLEDLQYALFYITYFLSNREIKKRFKVTQQTVKKKNSYGCLFAFLVTHKNTLKRNKLSCKKCNLSYKSVNKHFTLIKSKI